MSTVDGVALLEERLNGGVLLYHWQRRLLDEWLLEGRIPAAVDVPTGLGKTKVISAWLIARALGATLPRRLVYVVDRRAVVDQATTEAEQLGARLSSLLADDSVDISARQQWRKNLGLTDGAQLAISTLRGRFLDNRKWMDQPHSASIVVGTVDMVGSRLLFSGYGVRARMRAAHAGLLGCDALLVLDEAHLVPPFEALLGEVRLLTERHRSASIPPAFSVMALSATGRGLKNEATFQLNDQDVADPPVQARLSAEKRVRLLPRVESSALATTLAERAWTLAEGARRVLVFCNSRRIAQDTELLLASRAKRELGDAMRLTELFVGERRLRERTLMYDPPTGIKPESLVLRRFFPDAEKMEQPAFLVATSAAEVGVDLDADDLVCDLVTWERMVQRFGRVNRRRDPGSSRIEVIPSTHEKDAEGESGTPSFADMLAPFECAEWPIAADGTRDASPLAIRAMKSRVPELIERATSRPPYRPALSQAAVEAWAMTTLREHPGRALVEPWLRGWDENPQPQCSLTWRRYFPLPATLRSDLQGVGAEERSNLERFFEAAPPHATELLEVPVTRAVEILKKAVERLRKASADSIDEQHRHPPVVIVLDERYDFEDIYSVERIYRTPAKRIARTFAQRTLIVDARFGGLDSNGLLDGKAEMLPPTLDGEIAEWALPLETYGQRRIRWGTWSPPDSATEDDWHLQGFRWQENPDEEYDGAAGDELWVEIWRGAGATAGNAAITRRAQGLAEHHNWTRDVAKLIAEGIGLSREDTALLCAAAAVHDSGKDRDVWQNAMNASAAGRPFAKTTGGARPAMLARYRHEFGSLSDATLVDEIRALPPDDRELALHLVAAHHGRSRPSIEPIDPKHPPSHSQVLAQDSALRYVRLQRRWGAWGLAWWETLLRAADWAASRRVNEDE